MLEIQVPGKGKPALTYPKMKRNSQKGIAHIILILIILLAALAVWVFITKPWQAKPAALQGFAQEAQNKSKEFPQTNPFEVKTNPFKDIKTNPFR